MPLLSRGGTDTYSSIPTMPKAIRVPFAKLLLVQVPFPTCDFFNCSFCHSAAMRRMYDEGLHRLLSAPGTGGRREEVALARF